MSGTADDGSGLPSGNAGGHSTGSAGGSRLSFKDADIAAARREKDGSTSTSTAPSAGGQTIRSKIPRSKLRGSIMIMPSEGGVAGWELDTEHLRKGEGSAEGTGRAEGTLDAAGSQEGQEMGAGRAAGMEGGGGSGSGSGSGEGVLGYGGWRWAARVGRND